MYVKKCVNKSNQTRTGQLLSDLSAKSYLVTRKLPFRAHKLPVSLVAAWLYETLGASEKEATTLQAHKEYVPFVM